MYRNLLAKRFLFFAFIGVIGCGTASSSTQLPDVPSNLMANATASHTVALQWDVSAKASSYNVYKKSDQDDPYSLVSNTTSNSYEETDLVNGITYYFEVKAVNSAGESGPSNEVSIVPDFIINNPYQPKSFGYKGNTHTHTTNSDGQESPDDVAKAYKNAGYDFLVITDHDYLTTLDNPPDILVIKGVEETSVEGHIVAIESVEQSTSDGQSIIDSVVNAGGLAILAHPNYDSAGYTIDELEKLSKYTAIEVYNHVVEYSENHGNAEDKWDAILSEGRQIFGLAVDDMHVFDPRFYAKGWVKVFADSLTAQDIINNLKTGNFYASTGPDIAITVSGKDVTVTTDSSATIDFIASGGLVRFSKRNSVTATYNLTGDEGYVRVRVTRDSDGSKAWMNPIMVR